MYKFKYLIFLIFFIHFLFSQYGKNIVQYDHFEWYFIQTQHFDIYYYSPGEKNIDLAAFYAEEAYSKIANLIGWDLQNRSSIILYNSHNDFQQTNVVDSYMEEGIGGVTELLKNRMVIPFDGSLKDFKHVIYHELVHVFINDGIYGGSLKSLINSSVVYIPLWMNEGLAEYLSSKWDTNSDMWIRDLAINNEQLPPINSLGGYLAYRGGQSVWSFITSKWGEESIAQIFYEVQKNLDINRGFKDAIGVNIEELTEQWHKYLKINYWPDIAIRDDVKDIARQITDHEILYNNYNIAPSISPDGSKIAIYSNKDGEMGIYIISMLDGKFLKKIIKGNKTAEHEELHVLKPGVSWSPNGDKIVFAAKSGSSDALFIFNLKGKVKSTKISFEKNKNYNLEGITRPVWNPSNNTIAFIGNNGVASDVYLYNLDKNSLINVTNDWYSDLQVSWHPNGKDLLLISNRGDNLELGKYIDIFNKKTHNINNSDIYKLRFDNNNYHLYRLTNTDYNETYAAYSKNGNKMAYISDESGIFNINITENDCQSFKTITNVLTGITQLNWSTNNQILFSGFHKSGYDIFVLSNIDRLQIEAYTPPKASWKEKKDVLLLRNDGSNSTLTKKYSDYVFNEKNLKSYSEANLLNESMLKDDSNQYYKYKYNTKFTIDYGQAYYAFDSYYGAQAMGMFLWSDILGDHRVGFGTELQIDLKESDYFLFYRYLKNKLNHEGALYHLAYLSNPIPSNTDLNGNLISDYYTQELNRNFGIDYIASYPFSRFSRLQGGFNLDYFIKQTVTTDEFGNESTSNYHSQNLLKPYVKYTWDNTRWFYIYPVSGTRVYIQYDTAPQNSTNDFSYEMFTFDSRSYFEFSYKNKISLASRIYGGASWGKNKRKFLIGGTPWVFASDDNLINPDYESTMNSGEEYYFMNNYVFPIRGYEIASKYGHRSILMNYELRLPFLMYYFPTIQYLGQIFGVIFVDMGVAWDKKFPKFNEKESWNLSNDCYTTTNIFGQEITEYQYSDDCASGWIMSYGFGPRFILFGMPWKLDYAWQYSPHEGRISDKKWYLTIGFDF